MRIPVEKYTQLIAALYDADKPDVADAVALAGKADAGTGEMIFAEAPELYSKFGHIDEFHDLANAIKTRPDSVILDGSAPITISSDIKYFGRYDRDISPLLERITRRLNRRLESLRWEITFSFKDVGTLKKCLIDGTIYRDTGRPEVDIEKIRGGAVGSSVVECLTYAEEVIPEMVR